MREVRWFSLLLGSGLACLLLASSAPSARAVTVSVSPSDTLVSTGATFSVRVVADAFSDLKAYELIFKFDPSVIQYLGATAGDVLTGTGQPYTVQQLPDVYAPFDSAGVDCAQLVGSTSTPGVLIYFNFMAIADGQSPIECLNVSFRDSFNNETVPDCVGGLVRVMTVTPTAHSTWGRLKARYR